MPDEIKRKCKTRRIKDLLGGPNHIRLFELIGTAIVKQAVASVMADVRSV